MVLWSRYINDPAFFFQSRCVHRLKKSSTFFFFHPLFIGSIFIPSMSDTQSNPATVVGLPDDVIYSVKAVALQMGISLLLYGIYSTLFLLAAYVLLWVQVNHRWSGSRSSKLWFSSRNVLKSRPRFILLIVLVVMFLIATADLVCTVDYFFVQLPTLGFDPPDINETLLAIAASNNLFIRLNVSWRVHSDCGAHSNHNLEVCY